MSERYSRLYSLQENLYAYGAPVVIAAGALLKDNQTGRVLAQVKLKNITSKAIKAVRVSLLPFDTLGNPIGSAVEHQYLDLSANRDEDFGVKSPIFLPDAATRRFSAAVTEVAFADNTVWKVNGAPWEAMPKQKNLAATLQEQELVKQYKMKYGESCVYTPDTQKDLWRCTCGSINRLKESQCCNCKRSRSALMAIDLNVLREERDARLAAEAKKAAEEKAAAEARAKKLKKTAAIVISIAVVVIAVGCLLKQVVIPTVKYNQAVSLLEDGQYDEAIAAFEAMDGYKDSDSKVIEIKYQKSVARMNAGDYDAAIAGFKELAELEEANAEADKSTEASTTYDTVEATSEEPYKPNQFIKKYGKLNQYGSYRDDVAECIYRMGVEAFDAGSYDEAIAAFEASDGYKDSSERISEYKYNSAIALIEAGEYSEAIVAFDTLGDYKDAVTRRDEAMRKNTIINIFAGEVHAVSLRADGTCVATQYLEYNERYCGQCDVDGWRNIVSVSAGTWHTVGLEETGKVVATEIKEHDFGQSDVSNWTNIIAVDAGSGHTVGLKSDGTVIAVGYNGNNQCDVSGWSDVIEVSAGMFDTFGLRADGTVVTTGANIFGEGNVSDWADIVAVDAGGFYTVGLKADGTVVAVGDNDDGQCDVSDWRDIVAIAAGGFHTVGLKADGTVLAVGNNEDGACNVSGWRDIVEIAAGYQYTIGLKADGTVLSVGNNDYGQCNVSDWNDIRLP